MKINKTPFRTPLLILLFLTIGTALQAQSQMIFGSYTENFDTPGSHGWSHSTLDDFNWEVHSGPTTSPDTGPSSAYSGTNYIYAEASAHYNEKAFLVSPIFNLTGFDSPRVTYQFHMSGDDMGELRMDLSTDGGLTWSISQINSGDQGQYWVSDFLNIGSIMGNGQDVRFRFRAKIGNGYKSDIAIDYFTIREMAPQKTGTQTATSIDEDMENALANAFIYPNPVGNTMNLRVSELEELVHLEVFNLQGVRAMVRDIYPGQGSIKVDTKNLPSGMYLVRLSTENFSNTLRMVKE